MTCFGRCITLLAALLLIPITGLAQDRPQAQQNLVDQFRSGLVNGNAEKIAGLFVEDGRIYHSDGEIVEGRTAIRKDQRESFDQYSYVSVEWNPYDSYSMGEDVWVELGKFTGVIENQQDQQSKNTYEYTALNQKIDGEWMIRSVIIYRRGE